MHLDKFVHSKTGKIIMSIILGVGLATFFRTICKDKRCQLISAPPMEEIDNQTYRINDKCFTFEKNAISCNRKKQTVPIA